jgi:hypothetical protein
VFVRHRRRRRGKARDFASLASPASLIAPNHCQQMVCVGDAKFETARGSRHGFCVRVTSTVRLCRSHHVSELIGFPGDAVLPGAGSIPKGSSLPSNRPVMLGRKRTALAGRRRSGRDRGAESSHVAGRNRNTSHAGKRGSRGSISRGSVARPPSRAIAADDRCPA